VPDVPLVPEVPLVFVPLVPDEVPELDDPLPPPLLVPVQPLASQILCSGSIEPEHAARFTDGARLLLTPVAAPNPAARLSIGVAITKPMTAATESALKA
jgi:hypothetical protein